MLSGSNLAVAFVTCSCCFSFYCSCGQWFWVQARAVAISSHCCVIITVLCFVSVQFPKLVQCPSNRCYYPIQYPTFPAYVASFCRTQFPWIRLLSSNAPNSKRISTTLARLPAVEIPLPLSSLDPIAVTSKDSSDQIRSITINDTLHRAIRAHRQKENSDHKDKHIKSQRTPTPETLLL